MCDVKKYHITKINYRVTEFVAITGRSIPDVEFEINLNYFEL